MPCRTGSKPTAQISVASKFTPIEPLGLPYQEPTLEAYHKCHLKPITELKEVLQVIWDSLPRGQIDQAIREFSK